MAVYAVYNQTTGVIVNRIESVNGSWVPPSGFASVVDPNGTYQVGGTYIGGNYTPPAVSSPPPPNILDDLDRMDLVALRVLFNHENRVRALESKAPITMAQFKTAIRALA